MSNSVIVRSPFFYVGDKYKLMEQIKQYVPENIDKYIEPFVGGGSSFLNIDAKRYYLNDIDPYVIKLHQALSNYQDNVAGLIEDLYEIIDHYGLSCSFRGINVPDELKKRHIKTYYSHYNKEAYSKLKNDYNRNEENLLKLYILLIYGFNHMIRFNSSGEFNLPVGNVDYNKNVDKALKDYIAFVSKKKIKFYNMDYIQFLNRMRFTENTYVFFDPPYLISSSEYNKLWSVDKERELCNCLDDLNNRGIKFGITNLITHKGNTNMLFKEWAKQYTVHEIKSNYISFNDNTVKLDSREVFVSNYG